MATLNEKFNALHACLIPMGPHRGEVLVVDGNLRNYSIPSAGNGNQQRTRAKQPWAIVNPYWPANNPYFPGTTRYRFYNHVLTLPVVGGVNQGELFCGGHAWVHDGRLFWAGGTLRFPTNLGADDFIGSKLTWIFDPWTASWIQQADMFQARWYPSVTYDGNRLTPSVGRVLITGGTDPSQGSSFPGGAALLNHYESYQLTWDVRPIPTSTFDARTTGSTLPSRLYVGLQGLHGNVTTTPIPGRSFTNYPRVHLLTDGRFIVSGFEAFGAVFQHFPAGDPVYNMTAAVMPAGSNEVLVNYATSIYPANYGGTFNRILRIAGMRGDNNYQLTQSKLVEACDVFSAASQWTTGGIPNLLYNRMHANVVILPGGELFVVGGLTDISTSQNPHVPNVQPNVAPELLIANQYWTALTAQTGLRHYHSCALLLPDGRVLLCGGEGYFDTNSVPPVNLGRPPDYQIFNPPYITMGFSRPSGVTVTTLSGSALNQNAMGTINYGATYRVAWDHSSLASGATVDRVVLVRPAALTHHDDGGQRCVFVTSSPVTDATVDTERQFTIPSNQYQLPRGWWMLFLITNQSAPSDIAYWVHLD